MLILISDAFDKGLPDRLRAFGDVTDDKSRESEADVVLIRSKTKCTQEYIDGAPNLKLIIRGGVGLDNVDRDYAATKGVQVNNTPKASAIAVAEAAFALMIAVPNNLIKGHNGMAEGQWLKKELERTELYRKTLCLIGVGNIATEVAIRAKAFGMTVKAYRQSDKPYEHAEVIKDLAQAVADADYVSMHTPLTDDTRGMFDAKIINGMKDGAVIVNTGRGACVVAEDVVAALESGKLRGYATDVWPSDPPAEDYPILKAPNVVMLPHLGASTKENLGRIGDEVVAILESFKERN